MEKPRFFQKITIETPKDSIYRRLGYHIGTTRLLESQKKNYERLIHEALGLIKIQGCGIRIPIKEKNSSEIILTTGAGFESRLLARLLSDSMEALFMAATAGEEIIKAIQNSGNKNLSQGVVFDAVASEVVDASLNWIWRYFDQEIRRENKYLTSKRISCGYGDFLIDNQKVIYDILGLHRLNVRITESFMLTPEKSVTAVVGVQEQQKS